MGKYDGLLDDAPVRVKDNQLDIDLGIGQRWKAREDQGLPTIEPASDLAIEFIDLERQISDLSATVKQLKLQQDIVEALLIRAYDQKAPEFGKYGAKDNMIRLEQGGSIAIQAAPYAAVKDADRYRQWCIDNGYANRLTLLWQVTNSIVSAAVFEGRPVPDGTEAHVDRKIVFRKK